MFCNQILLATAVIRRFQRQARTLRLSFLGFLRELMSTRAVRRRCLMSIASYSIHTKIALKHEINMRVGDVLQRAGFEETLN